MSILLAIIPVESVIAADALNSLREKIGVGMVKTVAELPLPGDDYIEATVAGVGDADAVLLFVEADAPLDWLNDSDNADGVALTTALKQSKRIVVVLVGDAHLPADLPEEIASLKRRAPLRLKMGESEAFTDTLIGALKLQKAARKPQPSPDMSILEEKLEKAGHTPHPSFGMSTDEAVKSPDSSVSGSRQKYILTINYTESPPDTSAGERMKAVFGQNKRTLGTDERGVLIKTIIAHTGLSANQKLSFPFQVTYYDEHDLEVLRQAVEKLGATTTVTSFQMNEEDKLAAFMVGKDLSALVPPHGSDTDALDIFFRFNVASLYLLVVYFAIAPFIAPYPNTLVCWAAAFVTYIVINVLFQVLNKRALTRGYYKMKGLDKLT